MIYDITEAKRREEQLRTLNDTLETRVEEQTQERDRLWRLSRDPFLIAHEDGRWLNVNPAWAELLGWSEEELLGRTSQWMEHPDDRAKTRTALDDLASGSTTRYENRFRTKNGLYLWFSWTIVRYGGFLYGVARDVTAEKEQAAALASAETQLRQSQKMEAVGQLTGGLAHDFNNLLTGITGSLELLQTRVAQGRLDSVDRYITAAQGAASRAAALTHRLLAFSRKQTLEPKPTDPNRLVAGMEELVRRTVGPEITVSTVLDPTLWPTLCDPNQLENALLNLCINARDAMPNGGLLTIKTANSWLDELGARERGTNSGLYVVLSVSDTGTGMSPEVAARAFDPFFTTKPIGQGTGLGLSMIYGFAKQSGGNVQIESVAGRGTTMHVYLPRHLEGEKADQPGKPIAAQRAEIGQTVLVVDDEPVVRLLVTDVLEELGYGVLEADDAASGLAVLESDARIDLLVIDIGLPGGMNGRQVADAAGVKRPKMPVLFITGYAENEAVSAERFKPGMQVIAKPFTIEMLATTIKTIIARQ